MEARFEGRVAVVTGGASGMGREIALQFLSEGGSVVVADMNEQTGAETVDMAKAREAGERVAFSRTDVSRSSPGWRPPSSDPRASASTRSVPGSA